MHSQLAGCPARCAAQFAVFNCSLQRAPCPPFCQRSAAERVGPHHPVSRCCGSEHALMRALRIVLFIKNQLASMAFATHSTIRGLHGQQPEGLAARARSLPVVRSVSYNSSGHLPWAPGNSMPGVAQRSLLLQATVARVSGRAHAKLHGIAAHRHHECAACMRQRGLPGLLGGYFPLHGGDKSCLALPLAPQALPLTASLRHKRLHTAVRNSSSDDAAVASVDPPSMAMAAAAAAAAAQMASAPASSASTLPGDNGSPSESALPRCARLRVHAAHLACQLPDCVALHSMQAAFHAHQTCGP